MDPFRARNDNFGTSRNTNICYRRHKILIFLVFHVLQTHRFVLQIHKHSPKTPITCGKYKFLRIENIKMDVLSSVLQGALPQGLLFSKIRSSSFLINKISVFCMFNVKKHGLSKLGAPSCAPAGAFFPAK